MEIDDRAKTLTDDCQVSVEETSFSHAPQSYFAIDKLRAKGPRKNADVGQPHDATRPLATVGPTSAGSWWCASGGWPSPSPRATTEVFFVFEGHGCLTDLDGTPHYFGPGDTVVLPKGWSGRWDVARPIHKVWFVHDHPNVEESSYPIRAVITHYSDLARLHGSPTARSIYNVGPTEVGCLMLAPGSFPVVDQAKTEGFHVLEGLFFLTDADGNARRCVPGDTVVCPKGWSGTWDVFDDVRSLWVVVND
ncbi:hypothetical protein CTAYLR_004693 [Chrysophaeum taylorii]|uniref:(S)-ureidoglycine aminohydrolase cupin domain-containing protein n=1 Tax=Chrysophaeum taylorii TaxID=2483200 RepID=A0AAD7U863_9STRA|nr:hypothetical protein CTAYLR_004693 [Chrysophaeum taylorii]